MAFNLSGLRNSTEPSSIRKNYLDNVLEDFFNDFYFPTSRFLSSTKENLSPRIDISEADSEYKLEAELPGINLNDVEVKLDNNILTIKGNKEEDLEKKEKNYYIRERHYGSFQRSISMPSNIMSDKIDAKFENGILYISIPKNNQGTTKKIEVKGNS